MKNSERQKTGPIVQEIRLSAYAAASWLICFFTAVPGEQELKATKALKGTRLQLRGAQTSEKYILSADGSRNKCD